MVRYTSRLILRMKTKLIVKIISHNIVLLSDRKMDQASIGEMIIFFKTVIINDILYVIALYR